MNFPDKSCPGSRIAASGSSRHRAALSASSLAFRDTLRRFSLGFSMATNLLSKFDGRAIASPADQPRCAFLSVRASSSS